ncbi:MAG: fumarylacetoacetate hydrolase family protein [Mogibacterium sp.]|nr:fumarylacetoacetate hydrolase family protein [Mogibacterium sp.]
MKLYTAKVNGSEAVLVEAARGRFVRLSDLGLPYESMNDLIDNITEEESRRLEAAFGAGATAEQTAAALTGIPTFTEDRITICSPIPVPKQDLICLGVNYWSHIQETIEVEDYTQKEDAIYFSKRANYTTGPDGIIPCHEVVDGLDYEVELAVILGKDALNVSREEAIDYVFGYTIVNDVSARNLQFRHKQWYRGKSLDGYTPMGPCIVTAADLGDGSGLTLTSRVNGELRQNSNTDLLIQDVAGTIAELSQGMTLQKGTIISTGTPSGVAMGFKPPKFLKPGDVVECEITRIGVLRNVCR